LLKLEIFQLNSQIITVRLPAAFGLLLSAPRNRLIAVQSRWLKAGIQIALVEALGTEHFRLTVSVGLPASRKATKHESLISRFRGNATSAAEFQTTCLQMLSTLVDILPREEFDILQYLFTSADRYAADTDARWQLLAARPELRQYLQRLGEQELRADAHDAYWQLFGE
jgi:hypothetical protein